MKRTILILCLLVATSSVVVLPASAALRYGMEPATGEQPPVPQDPWYIRLMKAFWGDGQPSKWHNAASLARLGHK